MAVKRSRRRRGAPIAAVAAIGLIGALAVAPTAAGTAVGGAAPSAKAKGGPLAGASIVGGGYANGARWPFMAAILRKGNLHCGASVIAPRKLLTAAHCVLGFKLSNLTAVTGRGRFDDPSGGQAIPVASGAVHPDYAETFRHDVAVLTLASPTTAPPITLPTPEQAAGFTGVGQLLRVAGWGARNPLGFALSRSLRRTTEKVRANRRCKRAYRSVFSGSAMICAMGRRLLRYRGFPIHTTSCSGDSGGPLVADTSSGPMVVGIVSYGSSICGYSGTPTVYSRVSDALPFIAGAL